MNLHSFVIRIWQEEASSGGSAEKWRGHILHYPSQREQYIDDLCNIVPFMQSCTAHNGLTLSSEERARGDHPTSGDHSNRESSLGESEESYDSD